MTLTKLQEIRKNIIADGRTVFSWARLRGFHPQTVTAVLKSHYNLKTETAQAIFARLRVDGYLVDDPEEQDKAA